MFLKRLSLYNFRNYERLCFFPEQCSLIVGENGAGKTNILEALFFLVRGRSFRSSYPGSLIFYEKPVSQVSAEFAFDQKEEKVDMFLEKTGKKKVYLNGKVTTSSFLNRRIVTVLFSPESLTLLKSSANYRRLWVDQWLEMRGEDHYVRQFKKILIQKKRLLAQIKTGLISQKQGKHLQEGINEIFLQNSLNLTLARERSLREIEPFFKKGVWAFFKKKATFWNKEDNPQIRYQNQRLGCLEVTGLRKLERKDVLQRELERLFFKEQERGACLCGAHLEDFQIFFNNKDSRFFCSQGEQRALLIGLKKAQIQWIYAHQNRSVLLLLDDVFSEIDKHLIFNLLQFLENLPAQAILTSTEVPSGLLKDPFQVFSLKEGTLLKEKGSERRKDKPLHIL